jgi:hypothetical protein
MRLSDLIGWPPIDHSDLLHSSRQALHGELGRRGFPETLLGLIDEWQAALRLHGHAYGETIERHHHKTITEPAYRPG